jgi:Peptidase M15
MAVPKWISNVKNRRVRRLWKGWWLRPWTVPLDSDRAVAYKRKLRRHGRYSTHITIAEWRSHPDRCGCPVTASPYPRRTQKLAFKVERVRHRLGDIPIGNLSAYRSPCHERCIGGLFGYHPRGQALDPVKPPGMSATAWNAPWLREFGGGGIGIQRSTGVIRHVDTGARRRWFYA